MIAGFALSIGAISGLVSFSIDYAAMTLTVNIIHRLASIKADEWNVLSPDDYPFIRHEFLNGLEIYGCLERQNWKPCHVVVYSNKVLAGAMPLYVKLDSNGEFVFDWFWADAYQQAGGQYYPKLVSAIPFTPVAGPRLLVHPDYDNDRIGRLVIEEIIEFARENNISSVHCLFHKYMGREFMEQGRLLERLGCQYHWFNRDYRDFQDFLDRMRSKKRKKIKRERQLSEQSNTVIEILEGGEITEEQWAVYYDFYCSTFARKWGEPRFNLDFMLSLTETLPDSTLLLLAFRQNKPVAGALAMKDRQTLYGRHWGCLSYVPYLHFELCYYQTIDYCIRHRLKRLDAGAQGEHKINRGFEPVLTYSWHWINDKGFRTAISDFLDRESGVIMEYYENLKLRSVYSKVQ